MLVGESVFILGQFGAGRNAVERRPKGAFKMMEALLADIESQKKFIQCMAYHTSAVAYILAKLDKAGIDTSDYQKWVDEVEPEILKEMLHKAGLDDGVGNEPATT